MKDNTAIVRPAVQNAAVDVVTMLIENESNFTPYELMRILSAATCSLIIGGAAVDDKLPDAIKPIIAIKAMEMFVDELAAASEKVMTTAFQ